MFIARGLTKEFLAGTRVLDQVDVSFAAGEIHAVLGANGAGKSTLCKIIAGLHSATAGHMTLQGEAYAPASKQDAERRGVQIVQQELNLVPTLDVAHNLYLTRLPHRLGWIDQRTLYANARRLLDAFGLSHIDPRAEVRRYGVGERQMLEIAANLDRPCSVLILDEPTAALSVRETEALFGKLRSVRDRGTAIVYISHRLEEVLALSCRATVLRDGRWVGSFPIEELSQSRLVELMTHGTGANRPSEDSSAGGRPVNVSPHAFRRPGVAPRASAPAPSRPIGLQVRNASSGTRVRNVSFTARRGEVLGIAGLVGSGRTELLRILYGADRDGSGEISLGGNESATWRPLFSSPAEAVASGLVMISEDRKADGLLLPRAIRDNIVVSHLADGGKVDPLRSARNGWGGYRQHVATRLADSFRESLEIRSHDSDQAVETLSGGNQQKVVLAKWLLRGAEVWLLDEPTRGIDVASRELIYRVLRRLTEEDRTLVVVSSDLEELIEISDRIGVLSNGRWVGEFAGPDYSREAMTAAMFAGYGTAEESWVAEKEQ